MDGPKTVLSPAHERQLQSFETKLNMDAAFLKQSLRQQPGLSDAQKRKLASMSPAELISFAAKNSSKLSQESRQRLEGMMENWDSLKAIAKPENMVALVREYEAKAGQAGALRDAVKVMQGLDRSRAQSMPTKEQAQQYELQIRQSQRAVNGLIVGVNDLILQESSGKKGYFRSMANILTLGSGVYTYDLKQAEQHVAELQQANNCLELANKEYKKGHGEAAQASIKKASALINSNGQLIEGTVEYMHQSGKAASELSVYTLSALFGIATMGTGTAVSAALGTAATSGATLATTAAVETALNVGQVYAEVKLTDQKLGWGAIALAGLPLIGAGTGAVSRRLGLASHIINMEVTQTVLSAPATKKVIEIFEKVSNKLASPAEDLVRDSYSFVRKIGGKGTVTGLSKEGLFRTMQETFSEMSSSGMSETSFHVVTMDKSAMKLTNVVGGEHAMGDGLLYAYRTAMNDIMESNLKASGIKAYKTALYGTDECALICFNTTDDALANALNGAKRDFSSYVMSNFENAKFLKQLGINCDEVKLGFSSATVRTAGLSNLEEATALTQMKIDHADMARGEVWYNARKVKGLNRFEPNASAISPVKSNSLFNVKSIEASMREFEITKPPEWDKIDDAARKRLAQNPDAQVGRLRFGITGLSPDLQKAASDLAHQAKGKLLFGIENSARLESPSMAFSNLFGHEAGDAMRDAQHTVCKMTEAQVAKIGLADNIKIDFVRHDEIQITVLGELSAAQKSAHVEKVAGMMQQNMDQLMSPNLKAKASLVSLPAPEVFSSGYIFGRREMEAALDVVSVPHSPELLSEQNMERFKRIGGAVGELLNNPELKGPVGMAEFLSDMGVSRAAGASYGGRNITEAVGTLYNAMGEKNLSNMLNNLPEWDARFLKLMNASQK